MLQIVHEDVSVKNEQLEILYSNLQSNPVWQDCVQTANQPNESNHDDESLSSNPSNTECADPQLPLSVLQTSSSTRNLLTSSNTMTRDHHHGSSKRSRSLSPSRKTTGDSTRSSLSFGKSDTVDPFHRRLNVHRHSNRHKFLISSDMYALWKSLYFIVCHIT